MTTRDIRNPLETFLFEGEERSYRVHLPRDLDRSAKLPLVLILHGGNSDSDLAARMTEMDARAEKHPFIAVYPNGTGRIRPFFTWNSGGCCGYAFEQNKDDVGFIRALIGSLERTYPVDPARIYAAGFSNGGMMAYRLAVALSDKIAAIACVSGSMPVLNVEPDGPVPVLIFHGAEDEYVPYHGGEGTKSLHKRVDSSVSDAVSYWVKRNGCLHKPEKEEKGMIVKETYKNGKKGAEVCVVTLLGQGHAWPGSREGIRFGNLDVPSREISATDSICEFFLRHPKR